MHITESGIRKIVAEKIISEAGFDRKQYRVYGEIGTGGCDLSAIPPGDLAVFFAKNFVYSAEGLSKKSLLDSLKNAARFGRTEEEDSAFERAVLQDLQKNPERLAKYRSFLEGAITYFFGPTLSSVFCTFLNTLLGGGSVSQDRINALENSGSSAADVSSALFESASRFSLEYPDFKKSRLTKTELFLFPKTSIALSKGDNQKAVEIFRIESGKMRDIIESPRDPQQIAEAVQDYYKGIKNRRSIIRPLLDAIKNLGGGEVSIITTNLESEYNSHPFVKSRVAF